jgi:Zn-finger nucleic acid-binding protein
MKIMNCPRCETTALVERERDGIVLESCSNCRGLWLDRGELEKLIARATREYDDLSYRRDSPPPPPRRYDDDDDDDDYRRRHQGKRRWFDSLGDIFD